MKYDFDECLQRLQNEIVAYSSLIIPAYPSNFTTREIIVTKYEIEAIKEINRESKVENWNDDKFKR
jgi:hypothetical protein